MKIGGYYVKERDEKNLHFERKDFEQKAFLSGGKMGTKKRKRQRVCTLHRRMMHCAHKSHLPSRRAFTVAAATSC
jgi:hypothetical protein